MIAYVKGTVEQVSGNSVVLENQGVGYMVNASAATLSRLPRGGELAQLFTYMQLKEDGVSLFGFLSREELRLFRLLIAISGIGPKVAMAVLASMTPDQIVLAVASQDMLPFSKVPGIGKKTAQRITLELQDKIESRDSVREHVGLVASAESSEKQDAIEALLALGYGRSESLRAVLAVAEEDMAADSIIRLALKKISKI